MSGTPGKPASNAPVVDATGTSYCEAMVNKICNLLVEGMPLSRICRMDGMPSKGCVLNWLQKYPEFYDKYYKARQLQVEGLADEIVEIADDGTNDFVEVQKGRGVVVLGDHEHMNRSRLRIDARKFLLSKLHPDKYGEKLDLKHSGTVGAQLIIKGRGDDRQDPQDPPADGAGGQG